MSDGKSVGTIKPNVLATNKVVQFLGQIGLTHNKCNEKKMSWSKMISRVIFCLIYRKQYFCVSYKKTAKKLKNGVTKNISVCISIGLSGKKSSSISVIIQKNKTKNSCKCYPSMERINSGLYIDCDWCLRSFSSPPEPPLLVTEKSTT